MGMIKLNKDSDENLIKRYFKKVSELHDSGEEFPVNLDNVWGLAYTRKDSCVKHLRNKHIEGIDYQVFRQKSENLLGGRPVIKYNLSVSCTEYLIAREVKSVFEVYRSIFHAVRKGQSKHSSKFVERFHTNSHKVKKGYFSVTGYTYIYLYGELEKYGFLLPSYAINGVEIRPDNSIGRMFSDYLKKNFPQDANAHLFYNHLFPDIKKSFRVRQYPNRMIPVFIDFLQNRWIPERADKYLRERCPEVLEYLPKLLE